MRRISIETMTLTPAMPLMLQWSGSIETKFLAIEDLVTLTTPTWGIETHTSLSPKGLDLNKILVFGVCIETLCTQALYTQNPEFLHNTDCIKHISHQLGSRL